MNTRISSSLKLILIALALVFTTSDISAQELDFQVTINSAKAQKAEPAVFESLQRAIREFINTRDWVGDEFISEERIKGSIQLTISDELSVNSFKAEIAIQATRPVYGSTYETALLNHVDKEVTFTFEQFEPLIYTPNVYNDNLSSIISFYVYMILGLDYDTYAPLGGNPHFQLAQEVMNAVPSETAKALGGWTSIGGSNRNRFFFLDNLMNPKVKPYRRAMYDYHRQGLDLMVSDTETGKATILAALSSIDDVHKSYPNSMIVQMFSNTKAEEIIEIFKVAGRDQKSKVTQIMGRLDPAQSSKYRKIGR